MLCVVGDLLEDVVVHTAGGLVDTDNESTVTRSRGGSAANVAAAAAATGAAVRFIGRVGDDATGAALVEELAGHGVDVRAQRAGRTGTVVVVVDAEGRRTMYPDRAAAAQLGPIDASWGEGVSWVHLPAYSLCAEPIGASSSAFVDAVRCGGRMGLSVDVSSVGLLRSFGSDRFLSLLDVLTPDVVLATSEEAAAVGGPRRGSTWVVKDGARPVVVIHTDGRVESIAVPPVAHVVDTTGAGDAFAAGFLVSVMRGETELEAAGAGIALAARTLGVGGARLG